jgi:hypothetical protein
LALLAPKSLEIVKLKPIKNIKIAFKSKDKKVKTARKVNLSIEKSFES